MRPHKKRILMLCVERQGPDPETGQASVLWIDPRPRQARVRRMINAAAELSILISVAGKYFIAMLRIDQYTGEVAKRQITSASRPFPPAVVRRIKCLFRTHIDS